MATSPRSQIPLKFEVLGKDQKLTQPWSFWFQTLAESLAPQGSGYVVDNTAGITGPTSISQGAAINRGGNPGTNTLYFADDTGQIFTVSGGVWQEQSPALTGDITKAPFSNVTTLKNVNSNIGTFGNGLNIPQITVNAKGQVTGITLVPVAPTQAAAAGVNGSIQLNSGNLLSSNASLFYDGAQGILFTENAEIEGQITFADPIPTFTNLSPLLVKGDVIGFDGNINVRVPVGTDGYILTADSASSAGLTWVEPQAPAFIEVPFNFGDASPKPITVVPANKLVLNSSIVITTGFDGSTASLTVGSAATPDDIMTTSDVAPSVASTWSSNPNTVYGADTQVYLTINNGSGATSGSGILILQIQT